MNSSGKVTIQRLMALEVWPYSSKYIHFPSPFLEGLLSAKELMPQQFWILELWSKQIHA